MADYNKYYQTPELFGAPFPILLDFFKNEAKKGKVLDLGCGQGRNALAIARLGFEVTGIDLSSVGVGQMLAKARESHLNITGLCTDIYQFEAFEGYDYVVLDSMFHFHKKDKVREIAFIQKIMKRLNPGAKLFICNQDTGKKVAIIKEAVSNNGFQLIKEASFTYLYYDKTSDHRSKTSYKLLVWVKV